MQKEKRNIVFSMVYIEQKYWETEADPEATRIVCVCACLSVHDFCGGWTRVKDWEWQADGFGVRTCGRENFLVSGTDWKDRSRYEWDVWMSIEISQWGQKLE